MLIFRTLPPDFPCTVCLPPEGGSYTDIQFAEVTYDRIIDPNVIYLRNIKMNRTYLEEGMVSFGKRDEDSLVLLKL